MQNREETGKVGKNNPPKHTQFKKGESGNPNGRPEGVKNRATLLKKWLSVNITAENPLTAQEEEMSTEDAVVLSAIKEARSGNINAFNSIMDSVYGKLKETVELSKPNVLVPGE